MVRQESGRTVLVVQAYQYGKYLGMLNATFDDAGEVVDWAGNPILLDGEQDQEAEAALQEYREQVERTAGKEGQTGGGREIVRMYINISMQDLQ